MRILILSRNASLYSTERLVESAERRGHEVMVRDPLKFTIEVGRNPTMTYMAQKVLTPDFVIPRIGASITAYGLAVVRQFEEMGVKILNDSTGIACSRDKFRALQILSRSQIAFPRTVFVRRRSEIIRAIDAVGGVPVVIKLLEGAQGMGVVLARDLNTAQALIELLQVAKQNILIQKFVEEANGSDLRVLVLGDRVIAAMRRTAKNPSEFRANIHQGGRAEFVELSQAHQTLAVNAAKILGLKFAGVDMLESKEGPQVLEVNSSPGLEGIEKVSGVDIALSVIQYMEQVVDQ